MANNELDFATLAALAKALGGSADPAVIEAAVSDWLDAHPEATTTVQDGSITKAKLDSNLAGAIDDVGDLKTALEVLEPTATSEDVGKTLIAKTVSGGKVTEYEFGEAGAGNDVAPVIINSASGAVASFADGGNGLPMQSLVCEINPLQSGTGDPAPGNVRPITGFSGVTAYRTGKNLLNPNYADWALRGSAYAYLNDVVPSGQLARFTFIDKDTTVDISDINAGFVYDNLGEHAPTVYNWVMQNGSTSGRTFTNQATNGTPGLYCQNVFVNPQTEEAFNRVFARYYVMVELGSSPTTYAPYTGTSIPVAFPVEAGTVYGGTLDVISGVLTVTDAEIASYNGETLPSTWISDRDVYAVGTTPTIGAQVVYKLATPQTYQLTPQQITTLLGLNNVYHNANGNTDAAYRADTKLYIDTKLAALAASIINS